MPENKQEMTMIVKGSLLLTLSSFIAKLLSAFYKVPFQNLTGDEGFYVYQQVYPLYGIAVAFTLTAFPLFVSKIVSEAKNERELEKSIEELHSYFLMIAVTTFLFLQFGANFIAKQMGDIQLTPVIQSVSYFYLFLPFLAIVRGYFQGQMKMMPTSISQVIEQLVRVGILLAVALSFPQSNWSFYEMGAKAYHSAWISAIFAGLVLYLFLRKGTGQLKFNLFRLRFSSKMGKRILTEGFVILLVSSLLLFFQFIDSFTVFKSLLAAGFSKSDSMLLKGVYDRGQPLIQLGMVVGISFSTASLPILRKKVMRKDRQGWVDDSASILKMTIIIAAAATVGLLAIMPWMNLTLFKDQMATEVLQLMMVNILIISLIHSIQSILQSENNENYSVYIMIFSLAFKVLMNPLATRAFGIQGPALITIFSLLIILILMLQMVDMEILKTLVKDRFLLKISLLLIGMYLLVVFSLSGLESLFLFDGGNRLFTLLLTIIGVVIGASFYGIGLLKWNVLQKEELDQFTFIRKLKKKVGK